VTDRQCAARLLGDQFIRFISHIFTGLRTDHSRLNTEDDIVSCEWIKWIICISVFL